MQKPQYSREEVMQNLSVVCQGFQGTLTQHQYLQGALKWLNDQLVKAESVVEEPKEEKKPKAVK